MSVIPHTTGYLVTDGMSRVRSFDITNYPSRSACREDAITFSHEGERNDSDITNAFITYLLIEV